MDSIKITAGPIKVRKVIPKPARTQKHRDKKKEARKYGLRSPNSSSAHKNGEEWPI